MTSQKIKIKETDLNLYSCNCKDNFISVQTTSGYTWKTEINGTFESIKDYFFKNRFNVGDYPNEIMDKVTNLNVYKKTKTATILIASFQNK
jgi:hypothetical protein